MVGICSVCVDVRLEASLSAHAAAGVSGAHQSLGEFRPHKFRWFCKPFTRCFFFSPGVVKESHPRHNPLLADGASKLAENCSALSARPGRWASINFARFRPANCVLLGACGNCRPYRPSSTAVTLFLPQAAGSTLKNCAACCGPSASPSPRPPRQATA